MKHWYLVKTKSKQENIAILNLENQNFHVYCPFVLIRNKNEVLFPGYIFIQLDKDTQNWSPIRSTKGVLHFVRFGLSYAKIPDNIIKFIKANELNTVEKLKNINKFNPGDKVQISDGVFKNCIAIFKSYKSDERVILLINILGQQQKLTIKQETLNAL
ncbi:transcription/translation regulatory transformer protein RfaH [Candidatus Thioglobus sp.]|nr:transcription/translation regulatory transformer protein RfaH [Candidatus Thioglobus sp.]